MDLKPLPDVLVPLTLALRAGQVVVALDCTLLLGDQGPFQVKGLIHRSFADLGAEFLARLQPSLLVLPLFTSGYDAVIAVEALEVLGYRGRIAVLAPHLPKPHLVERELQVLGPGARLVLITP